MPYFEFLWIDDVVRHLAEHGIETADFEKVVSRPHHRGRSTSTGRPCCWGESADGRYLLCVYKYIDEVTILPVTAYEVRRPRA